MRHLAVCLALAVVSQISNAGCLPILGTVQLSEDADCKVQSFYPGLSFIGAPNCYKDVLKIGGLLPAYGYSGVTTELMTSVVNGAAYSPAVVQGGRVVMTARSTFSLGGTQIHAAEIITQSNPGNVVTEQSIITGTDGNGLFKNATGYFMIKGDSTQGTAQVTGQICTP